MIPLLFVLFVAVLPSVVAARSHRVNLDDLLLLLCSLGYGLDVNYGAGGECGVADTKKYQLASLLIGFFCRKNLRNDEGVNSCKNAEI
jgi:hypothetical protein